MNWLKVVGWIGNAAFFSRFLVQWLLSERARRSIAPRSFWWLSLIGAMALGIYTMVCGEPVLLAGNAVNASISARNLWIASRPGPSRTTPSAVLLPLGVGAVTLLFWASLSKIPDDLVAVPLWFTCSVVGQAFWSSRFVVQWWASERRSESHFPVSFWWLSLVGNAFLLAYSVHRGDPVLIAGFVPGPLVQVRNLMLARRAEPRPEGA
jgi:lipid-A-disaccharide synthase-like uncharacterized protein